MSTLSDGHDDFTGKFPILEPRREARALDEGQIGATAVLLALCDDELLIGEGANHRPHLYAEFAGRPQAAMTECDLVALGVAGLRTNQDRIRSARAGG